MELQSNSLRVEGMDMAFRIGRDSLDQEGAESVYRGEVSDSVDLCGVCSKHTMVFNGDNGPLAIFGRQFFLMVEVVLKFVVQGHGVVSF